MAAPLPRAGRRVGELGDQQWEAGGQLDHGNRLLGEVSVGANFFLQKIRFFFFAVFAMSWEMFVFSLISSYLDRF